MNCKPGDLAVIVSAGPMEQCVIGHICRIVQREDHPLTREPGWHFEPPARNGCDAALDRILRPLRDPGDDAKDEMLRPLPADVGVCA